MAMLGPRGGFEPRGRKITVNKLWMKALARHLFLDAQFLFLQLRYQHLVGEGALRFHCDSLVELRMLGRKCRKMRGMHEAVLLQRV